MGTTLSDPGRQACTGHEVRQHQGGQRRLGGRLDDHGAPGGQRGGDLARDHGRREVPRRHQHGHANGLQQRDDVLVAARCSDRCGRWPARPPRRTSGRTRRRRPPHRVRRPGSCRPPAMIRSASSSRCSTMSSYMRRSTSPRSRGGGRGPARGRRGRRGDGVATVVGRGAGDVGDDLVGRGIAHLEARAVRPVAPLPRRCTGPVGTSSVARMASVTARPSGPRRRCARPTGSISSSSASELAGGCAAS